MNKYILSAVATVGNLTACASLEHKPYPEHFTPPSIQKPVQDPDVEMLHMVNQMKYPEFAAEFNKIVASTRVGVREIFFVPNSIYTNLLALEDIKPQSQTD